MTDMKPHLGRKLELSQTTLQSCQPDGGPDALKLGVKLGSLPKADRPLRPTPVHRVFVAMLDDCPANPPQNRFDLAKKNQKQSASHPLRAGPMHADLDSIRRSQYLEF